ncbi:MULTISPECIES: hypothetical protein [Bacillus]|uniref:hypothetical protein n=1 Tax=Bacillus TaxID=1386 RepID=UPI000F875F7F|nr:hypothetical protein [Bacillus pumilus]MEE3607351.1 hypothetical protein [Bacillus altitudinis]MEE3613495.1 hypothetical protein [Bacillus altitudinis]MEE3649109.1 hypothetical protein [Bacillus altitudinis]MEE4393530.1 hypothetical protein [Bacillus altitudinis]MEE4397237.1 hypothetical protein [Bacillus altitudinis]
MKKKTWVTVIVAGTILIGGAGAAYSFQANASEKGRVDRAENAVTSIYTSPEDLNKKNYKEAESFVKKISDDEKRAQLTKKLSNAYTMHKAIQMVEGDIQDGIIADGLKAQEIEVTKEYIEKVKPIDLKLYKTLTKKADKALEQVIQIEKTKQLFSRLNDSYDWKTFKKIEKEAKKVLNENESRKFQKQLDQMEKRIEQNEKRKAKIKRETEELSKNNNDLNTSKSNNTDTKPQEKKQQNGYTSPKKYVQKQPNGSGNNSNGSGSQSKPSKKPSQPSKPTTPPKQSKPSKPSGNKDLDAIGKDLENKDWNRTGSGEIDKGGNSWESWD